VGILPIAGVESAAACWQWEGAARGLVLRLKLGARRDYSRPLVEGLTGLVRRVGTSAAVVTWPPCSRADKRRRGFDHAEVLARGVAERVGLPARPLLRRIGRASDQSGLTGAERRLNLVGTFVARPSPHPILLVDDVVTTGATLASCSSALRSVGAPRVEGIVACSANS
jgi:predicted amidophosphoribosyltransferase